MRRGAVIACKQYYILLFPLDLPIPLAVNVVKMNTLLHNLPLHFIILGICVLFFWVQQLEVW